MEYRRGSAAELDPRLWFLLEGFRLLNYKTERREILLLAVGPPDGERASRPLMDRADTEQAEERVPVVLRVAGDDDL